MRRFYQIWSLALVVKTIVAIWAPFSNDEAYYWVWGHHPQWSYFDHPPAVGWLMWLGTFIENFGNAARLPGVWLGHGTLLIWARILRRYLPEEQLGPWLLFVIFSPFFGLGSLVITPDVPLLFFWSLSLLLLLRLLEKPELASYAAFGASLGLGFCSKYMIVLFVPTTLIWLALSGDWRRVRWAWVPVTVVTGLLFCFPVLWWNHKNEWASILFQLDHGLNDEKWTWNIPFEYLGGQFLLIFPVVLWFAVRKGDTKGLGFLHYFAWFPLAFFFYTSFKARVEANWPLMAYPALLTLAFVKARNSKWLRFATGTWILATVLVLSELLAHWIPVDQRNLKTSELTRYDIYLPYAQSDQKIYLGSYQAAAAVSYKLRRQHYKLAGASRRDFYDFLPESTPSDDKFYFGGERYQPISKAAEDLGYVEVGSELLNEDFRIAKVQRAQSPDR